MVKSALISAPRARAQEIIAEKGNKAFPLATGVLDYFPDALMEVALVSVLGNEQHNPGQPLHWSKSKSDDHADTCVRHLRLRGKWDSDGARHSGKAAWRALANLQIEIEQEREGAAREAVLGDQL